MISLRLITKSFSLIRHRSSRRTWIGVEIISRALKRGVSMKAIFDFLDTVVPLLISDEIVRIEFYDTGACITEELAPFKYFEIHTDSYGVETVVWPDGLCPSYCLKYTDTEDWEASVVLDFMEEKLGKTSFEVASVAELEALREAVLSLPKKY